MSYLKQFFALSSICLALAVLAFVILPQSGIAFAISYSVLGQLSALLFVTTMAVCLATVIRSQFKKTTVVLGIVSALAAALTLGWIHPEFSALSLLLQPAVESLWVFLEQSWLRFPNALLLTAVLASLMGMLVIVKASESLAKALHVNEHLQFLGLAYCAIGLSVLVLLANVTGPSHELLVVLSEAIKVCVAIATVLCSLAIPRKAKPKRASDSLATFTAVKGC